MAASQYTINSVIHDHDTGEITVLSSMVTLTPDVITFYIRRDVDDIERTAVLSIHTKCSPETVILLGHYGVVPPADDLSSRRAG